MSTTDPWAVVSVKPAPSPGIASPAPAAPAAQAPAPAAADPWAVVSTRPAPTSAQPAAPPEQGLMDHLRHWWQTDPYARALGSSEAFLKRPIGSYLTGGETATDIANELLPDKSVGGAKGMYSDLARLGAGAVDFFESPEGIANATLATATGGASAPFQAGAYAAQAGSQEPAKIKAAIDKPSPENIQDALTTGALATGLVGEAGKGALGAPGFTEGMEAGKAALTPTLPAPPFRGALADRMAQTPAGSPFSQNEVLEAAQAHGVNLDVAQATQHPIAVGAKKVGEFSLTGSGPYAANTTRNLDALGDWVDSESQKYSPTSPDREALGAAIQNQLESDLAESKAEAAKGFEDLDKRIGANSIDVTPNVQAEAKAILAEKSAYYREHPELKPKQAWAIIQDLAAPPEVPKTEDAAPSGLVGPDGKPITASVPKPTAAAGPKLASWSELHDLRSDLMDFYRNNPEIIKNQAQSWIQRMVSTIDQTMTGESAKLNPDDLAQFRHSNAIWEGVKDTYDNPQSPFYSMLRTDTPSTIPQTLVSAAPETLARAREILGPLEGPLQRHFVESVVNAKDGQTLDLKNANAKLGRIPQDRVIAILGDEGARNLRLLGSVAQRITADVNPSGTAKVGVPAGELGTLITHPVAGAAELAAQRVVAKAMTDPRLLNYLTQRRGNLARYMESPARANAGAIAGAFKPDGTPPRPNGADALSEGARPEMASGPVSSAGPAASKAGAIARAMRPLQGQAPIALTAPGSRDTFVESGGSQNATVQAKGIEPGGNVLAPRRPGTQPTPGEATTVRIPGQDNAYAAHYEVRELADIQPSHSGVSFAPNPNYALQNERDYTNPVNQGKIVNGAAKGKFVPEYLITDNPDATNGPPVIDSEGHALGGNGRSMILQRVYQYNPDGADAYKALLVKKAANYGVDAKQIQAMKQPVLVRTVDDQEFSDMGAKQSTVPELNRTGTASLTPSERAIADAKSMKPETLDWIGGKLAAKGEDATLADLLRDSGTEVVNRLIDDGVISPNERAAYVGKAGITDAGKERVAKLVVGRFFDDASQLDNTPPAIRQKLEKMAAPLASVNDARWDITPVVKGSLEALAEARAHGLDNIDDLVNQPAMFGKAAYSAAQLAMAKLIAWKTPAQLTKLARQYAGDAQEATSGQGNMLGVPPTQEQAFADAFQKGKD